MDFFNFKDGFQSTHDAIKWWYWRAFLGLFLLWGFLVFLVPLTGVIYNEFSYESWQNYFNFLYNLQFDPLIPLKQYKSWFYDYMFNEPYHYTWSSFFAWRLLLLPTLGFVSYQFYLFHLNPFHLDPQLFGADHEATDADLEKMGLYAGKHLLMGICFNKKVKMKDTRSMFCTGAPGCGKTAGIIIPAILEENEACLIIHDPKGEIAKATSGHRATLGPVFCLNWMGKDDKDKNIRWPSWNPFGEGNLPPLHAGREGYIDGLVSFLIPDGPSGTDPYWVKTGRGCLTGLTGYLCGKVEQAMANDYFIQRLNNNELDIEDKDVLLSYYESMRDFDEVLIAKNHLLNDTLTSDTYLPIGSWEHIPQGWHSKQACFAMLLDIINNAQIQYNHEIAVRKDKKDPTALNLDPFQMMFDQIVLETAYYGYGRRTLLELNQVLSLPAQQRGSVVSMALSGVNIFKNATVRCRTSLNDFTYNQLRGVKNPDTGKYQPITIYLSVPYADLKSSVQLSSLFINMATAYLMEFGPNEGEAGPFSASFMLDEFQHMPSLDSIKDGIVFGRSKQNKFLISVQDWHQIITKYSEEVKDIIINSVGVKILKRHNNPDIHGSLRKGTGSVTKVTYSTSSKGWVEFCGPLFPLTSKDIKTGINLRHTWSKKIKIQADGLVGGSGMMSMKDDAQLVLYSGHLKRPIKAKSPLYFKYPEYKALSSIKPAPPMPDYIKRDAADIAAIGTMHFTPIVSDTTED